MAKMNKYWGMVAFGALTAAAVGAAAAVLKKKAVPESFDFDDDFDEYFDTSDTSAGASEEVPEDFVSWEAAQSEEADSDSEEPGEASASEEAPADEAPSQEASGQDSEEEIISEQ